MLLNNQVLSLVLAAFAGGGLHAQTPAIMPPPGCGFYLVEPNVGELTARYKHCGDDFILIKYHWDIGTTGTDCVPPWYERPFYRDGKHRIVKAYYVPVPPNIDMSEGYPRCAWRQPRA